MSFTANQIKFITQSRDVLLIKLFIMKKYLLSIGCCLLLWSCEKITILSNDNCLKCSYQTIDEKISKEVCDDENGSAIGKEEMREQMQMEADAVGVVLSCQSN